MPIVGNVPRFGQAFTERQRAALQRARSTLTEQVQNLAREAEELRRDREPGDAQFSDESGEGDSTAVERDLNMQLSARERDEIDQIDAALKRIDDGTYGYSLVSGKPIPQERLKAVPEATVLVGEKTQAGLWR